MPPAAFDNMGSVDLRMKPYGEWQRQSGGSVFFPAAAAYAALALPASILAMTGNLAAPGLASPSGHAHEMLFGFALAVIAGNQLGPTRVPRLAVLLLLWVAARIAFVAAPASALSAIANCAFPLALALPLLPRRFKAVKKLRNFALPAPFAAICLAACSFELASFFGQSSVLRPLLEVTVLVFALLMLFMGGRLIAPAIAGQFYRQGAELDARVQPKVEGALIAAMAIALLTAAFVRPAAGFACEAAALLTGVRITRWRLWALRGRPDLICLAAGYGWLALGLLALGAAWQTGFHATAALHVLTIGALGTLTLNVMAFSWMAKAGADSARERIPLWSTLLLAAALAARIAADFPVAGSANAWLFGAASCWCAAFVLLLVLFRRTRRTRGTTERS